MFHQRVLVVVSEKRAASGPTLSVLRVAELELGDLSFSRCAPCLSVATSCG